jgi:hypothetical protein
VKKTTSRHNSSEAKIKVGNYIQWNNASHLDLQPKARLYRIEEMLGYVARIGSNNV